MRVYTFTEYFPSDINSMSDLLGENWTLKSYSSKSVKFTQSNYLNFKSGTQVKMYKRSLFNISGKLSGIEKYFSSCYSPNILDVGITLNCEGLSTDEGADFQKDELLEPIKSQFTSAIIGRIFLPVDILATSNTVSADEDGKMTLVNTDNQFDTYNKTFYNSNKQYKIYFPQRSKDGNYRKEDGDGEVAKEDIIDVINQNKLYSISLSSNDKIYTLNATSLA